MGKKRKGLAAFLGVAAWEGLWWVIRRGARADMYAMARARATALNRPLIVVGAPDAMITAGYPCGDVTVDLVKTSCPNAIQADVTKPLPFNDDSAVVFVSCVLEYVDDYASALAELQRVAGANLFITRVEPWTLTGWFFPGAKRRLPASIPGATVN